MIRGGNEERTPAQVIKPHTLVMLLCERGRSTLVLKRKTIREKATNENHPKTSPADEDPTDMKERKAKAVATETQTQGSP
jgi:hypothetical protein